MSTGDPSLTPAATNAGDLNDLLEIINGTTNLMENVWAGRDQTGKYLAMLRESIDRAAEVTARMVAQANGATLGSGGAASGREVDPVEIRSFAVKPCVLIVDDEPVTLNLFAQVLAAGGYSVLKAGSGCQALDILTRDSEACDLVILDLAMPFMGGEETFRLLRVLAPGMPVIVATAFVDEDVLEALREEGLAAFISKPLPPNELLTAVNQVLGMNNPEGEASPLHGTAAAR